MGGMTHPRPAPDGMSRTEQMFDTIHHHPGHTANWLKFHLGVGSGTTDRALAKLLAQRLIEYRLDDYGRKIYFSRG